MNVNTPVSICAVPSLKMSAWLIAVALRHTDHPWWKHASPHTRASLRGKASSHVWASLWWASPSLRRSLLASPTLMASHRSRRSPLAKSLLRWASLFHKCHRIIDQPS